MAPSFLSQRQRDSNDDDLQEVLVDAPGSDVAWAECLRDMKRTMEGGSVSIIGAKECPQITSGKSGLIAGDMSRQACSSALEVLKKALQNEFVTNSDNQSPCDCDNLALAVARHISVGPGLQAVIDQKLPAALWQPTFAVCVSPTQVRVLLLAYAGSPVFGDRPSSKTAPYLLKVLTDNLLSEAAVEGVCVKEPVRAKYCLLKAPDRVTSIAQHLELMQPLIVSAGSDGDEGAWVDCLTAQPICQQSSFASSMSSVRSSSLIRNLNSAKALVAPSLSSNSTTSRASRGPAFGDRAARLRSAFERAQSPSVSLQQHQQQDTRRQHQQPQANRPPRQPPQTTVPSNNRMETTTSSHSQSFSSTASGQQAGPVAAYAFNASLSTSSNASLAAKSAATAGSAGAANSISTSVTSSAIVNPSTNTTTNTGTSTTTPEAAAYPAAATLSSTMPLGLEQGYGNSTGTSMSSWCKVGAPPPAAASARVSSRSGTPTTTTTMAASPSPSSSSSSLAPAAAIAAVGGGSSMGQSVSEPSPRPLSAEIAGGEAGEGSSQPQTTSKVGGNAGPGLAAAPGPGMGCSASLGYAPPSNASLESCDSRQNQPTCSRFLTHAGARSPPPRRPPPHKAPPSAGSGFPAFLAPRQEGAQEPPRPSVSVLADGLSVKSMAGLWNNLATSTSGWWQSQRGSMTPPVPRKMANETRGSTSVVDRRSRMHATLSAGTPEPLRPIR